MRADDPDPELKCVRCGRTGQVHANESSLSRVFSCAACGHHWLIPRFKSANDSDLEDETGRM